MSEAWIIVVSVLAIAVAVFAIGLQIWWGREYDRRVSELRRAIAARDRRRLG